MRILQISQDYLPAIGGIANHVYNLSKALSNAGIPTTVATQQQYPFRNLTHWKIRRETELGIDRISLPILYSPRNLALAFQQKYRFAPFLDKIIRKEKYDLIHWHTYTEDFEIVKCFKGKIPLVFTNHSSLFLLDIKKGRPHDEIAKFFSFADLILAPSLELREETLKLGIPENKVVEIDNGVDVDLFYPIEIKEKESLRKSLFPQIPYGHRIFICGRRFVHKNGIQVLVEALNSLSLKLAPDVSFVFMGCDFNSLDPYEIEQIKRLQELKEKGMNIHLLGLISLTEVHNYYKAADFSILPSIIEAKSITALESMAAGNVVLSSDTGGLPQLIKNGETGFLFKTGDSKELADKLLLLLSMNKTALFDISQKGRRFVLDHYSWKMIAQKHINLYQSLIN